MKIILLCFVLFVVAITKPDLFLGAGGVGYGCGSNSPAVQRPFSYVRLGPDTTPILRKMYFQPHHFGGYSTMDRAIRALSHMHLVGAGVADMGILGILPIKSRKLQVPKDPSAVFYKSTQYAEPGYYSTTLQHNITIELTTTQRCGLHRYKFPQTKNQSYQVYIMSSYLIQKKAQRNSQTRKCGQNCIEGSVLVNGGFGGRFGGYRIYYYLKWTSKQGKNEKFYFFNDTKVDDTVQSVKGNYSGAIIETNAKEIQIHVGLSYVSIANAKQNLQKQVQQLSFDQIKYQSLSVWKDQLSRFQLTAISDSYQTKLDTAVYRTLLTPTLFSDFNGQYPSFSLNGTIMTKPQYMQGVYTDMSLWDVHRTQIPWLLFHDEKRYNDIARSIMLINKEGQYMPKWPFANGHTGCMIGAHANTLLADWIVKGKDSIKRQQMSQVLEYMLRNANTVTKFDSRPNPDSYKKLGYIAADDQSRSSCSETLQLSYNDFGISQVASILGKLDVQKDFLNRSTFFKNVWNNQTKFFQPRKKEGSFVKISQAERINIFSNHYVEGDAWHYRFYAPHNPQGLMQLFGGIEPFVHQLKQFFDRSFYWPTLWLPNPYYWAGNQHDLFSVWLFPFANRSDMTQKYSRKIMQTSYGTDGAGLPGNDDYGTMSAWLIFAGLGFYPVPSQDFYVLGSPVVHSATIYRKKADGRIFAFNVNAQNNLDKKHKVQVTTVNGKQTQNFVKYEDLNVQNALLNFQFSK